MGKFESIHIGHRALISEMKKLAQPGLATALVVFEPHPYRVLFDPSYKPLYTRLEREHLAREQRVDYLLEYQFGHSFAALSPKDFCRKIFEELQAKIVVVGEDYRFGHKRIGTTDTLRQAAKGYNAQVHVMPHHGVHQNGDDFAKSGADKTSTSLIRELLSSYRLSEAERLLGDSFFVICDVTQQTVRDSGFPTIKLAVPEEKFLPPEGVYMSRLFVDARIYDGLSVIGLRPGEDGVSSPRRVEMDVTDAWFNSYVYHKLRSTRGYYGGDMCGKQVRIELSRHLLFP